MENGDIVQITDENHHWYPALIVVDEVKSWGVMGYAHIIKNTSSEPNGQAYIRLNSNQYEHVGCAVIVAD